MQFSPLDPQYADPRTSARALLLSQLDAGRLKENQTFVASLLSDIKSQTFFRHPVLKAMRAGTLNPEQLALVHLEFRSAVVSVFTDAILMAQFLTRELVGRLGPSSQMAARFLLTLNLLDELGFKPGVGAEQYFRGHPMAAHYCMFDSVLDELGVSSAQRAAYRPSAEAEQVRAFIEGQFGDYLSLLAVLASTEETAMIICPAMRVAAEHAGLNVGRGYYLVHGASSDEGTFAFDDDHQNDVAFALVHALTPSDYEAVARVAKEYGRLWVAFWDRIWTSVCSLPSVG